MADIQEIRVFDSTGDSHGKDIARQAEHLGIEANLQSNKVYYVEGVSESEAKRLAEGLLSDPNTQDYTLQARENWSDKRVIEVAPLPGVTDPEAEEVMSGARIVGVKPAGVQTATEYRFSESTSRDAVLAVAGGILVNETVAHVRTAPPETLKIAGETPPIKQIPIYYLGDRNLEKLSAGRKLALNLAEMRAIRDHARELDRDLTDGEVEYLAGAWSEHCRHKTFNGSYEVNGEEQSPLFDQIKDSSKPFFEERGVVSAFHDNSGVWRFYDGHALAIKLETHNSPMNLEPYGGAATGTGGVLRDIVATGKGAKVINSQHMQFLAPLDYTEKDLPSGAHTPAYLLSRSVAGVGDYGNRMGIPTNNGSFHTHPNYRGKGSILVGALGIMPEGNAEKGEPQHSDLVVTVGGRTGRDGIHGATFSSESADSGTSQLHSGAVQIGNPIVEKKMFDAIQEASEKGLIRAITDCGAAGFASAIGEMGEDIGVEVDLAKAPLKYSGLAPWEIFQSESQERMIMAIDPDHADEIRGIFAKHQSESTVLGTFGTGDEAMLKVTYGDEILIDLGYSFIKDGLPMPTFDAEWTQQQIEERAPEVTDIEDILLKVLGNGNICSKEPLVRKYDHEVQGMSAEKPYGGAEGEGPSDAAVMTPLLDKPYAVIEAHGCNPALTDLDPRYGSIWSYVEAMSNYVAAGGNPNDAVIVNNYISATPNERVMGALHESVGALTECVKKFRTPIISGKDSLSSTYKFDDGSILESPYNLIITIAGKIPDVEKTVSTDLKKPGSTLVLVGKQDIEGMGGSVFYEEMGGASARVPQIDLDTFHTTANGLYDAIQKGAVLSAHDISEGGVAAALSEMAFGGNYGVELHVRPDNSPHDFLFNETAGCFVVEVESAEIAEDLFDGTDWKIIGKTVRSKNFTVDYAGKQGNVTRLANVSLQSLKAAWQKPMKEIFG